ncbi:F-box domain protein [Aspergillus clavatus NRRL 1]|uniref:F-box domain protein n=1 Tax=Aspergillus clavatus (strain ATCC 1007 / CBS 513.65 / DSM 816 / NCTC 3887 / NRRL 1 / QM 1276 / 107) TaxID=344612 RepID=A1C4F3_ASPCL|nr:F-box domain protein [Aspergillus clavatus NRRL 1]EAW15293.1 F-box domain protein [Aspergillus clavatus NRRL 1]
MGHILRDLLRLFLAGERACRLASDAESDDGYDAEVLAQSGDLTWLEDLYAFGYNPQAAGGKKTFITGPGVCSPWGEVELSPADAPDSSFRNRESPVTIPAYHDWSGEFTDMPSVYPVHQACFNDLLRRCLAGSPDGEIDEDVLFRLRTDRDLKVDYGLPSPPREQFWERQQGHEAVVANPVEIPQLVDVMGRLRWLFSVEEEEQQGLEAAGCLPSDPFYGLPDDIRLAIFENLPMTSILAVRVASGAMRSSAILPKWWGRKIRIERPWCWELHAVIPAVPTAPATRLYGIFVDIDDKSTYDETSNCFWGGLVNRRRIWSVCEEIKTVYYQQLAEQT